MLDFRAVHQHIESCISLGDGSSIAPSLVEELPQLAQRDDTQREEKHDVDTGRRERDERCVAHREKERSWAGQHEQMGAGPGDLEDAGLVNLQDSDEGGGRHGQHERGRRTQRSVARHEQQRSEAEDRHGYAPQLDVARDLASHYRQGDRDADIGNRQSRQGDEE